MPAAHRLGLMSRIDLRVLRDALAVIRHGGFPDGYVSINLSAQSLGDPLFGEDALAALDLAGVSPQRLHFEITEREYNVGASPPPLIEALRNRGHAIWLDDFGSGSSSFESLRRLAPDGIKIQREYISQIETEPVYRHFIDAACSAMHEMGGQVIAEGVESPWVHDRLRDKGISFAQGYLFGDIDALEMS